MYGRLESYGKVTIDRLESLPIDKFIRIMAILNEKESADGVTQQAAMAHCWPGKSGVPQRSRFARSVTAKRLASPKSATTLRSRTWYLSKEVRNVAPPRIYALNASAREFRALMESTGLTTESAVSEFIGIKERSIRGYRNGDPIPEPVIRLMRAYARYPRIDPCAVAATVQTG
jgi:hypothetical protein